MLINNHNVYHPYTVEPTRRFMSEMLPPTGLCDLQSYLCVNLLRFLHVGIWDAFDNLV